MADNGVLVTISGAALSLLLYENVRSAGDQMGLLLGDVQTFITKNLTDCDRQVEHVKHHINIDTLVVCSNDILQNSLGRINTEKLENLIKNKGKSVVGWFRFRRYSALQQTMRDKMMHKEFASHFAGVHGASEEHFIMFLLNATTTSINEGTHKYRHLCLQYKQGTFQPVALRINNLGSDAARHDGSDYKPVPENKPREADVFTKFWDGLKLNPEISSSVEVVKAIQQRADQYLNHIISEVGKSDQEISHLQKQVNELRAKVLKGNRVKNSRLKEKEAEVAAENERIYTMAQIHDTPRSTHSENLFDSDQSPVTGVMGSNMSFNTSSPKSHLAMKNLNIQRTKQHVSSKESRNHSSQEPHFYDLIRSDSSPESTRSKEGTPNKLMNKGNLDEKRNYSRRQTNSPKSAGKKSERYSYGSSGEQSHEEASSFGRKEQSPRPSSYSESR